MTTQLDEKLEVKYGLPRDVKYCVRCTASNQRPSSAIEFLSRPDQKKEGLFLDGDGVCAACRYFERKKSIDWKSRERELEQMLARYRRSDGLYDCIIPGSGGKDSRYVSHLLKTRYGMHPLTVTWAPHLYTEIGWKNLQSWIHSGFDNILFTPNGNVHRILTRLAFLNLAHPFQPFIIGQKNIGPRFSVLYNVPLVIYGEHLAEYGKGPDVPVMDEKFYSTDEIRLEEIFLSGISAENLITQQGIDPADLNPYLPVPKASLRRTKTEVHCLSYYLPWDPQENYYYAVEKTGFEANTERTEGSYSKYSSIDDVLDHLHYYTTYAKFGMGRASYDAEQEVRTGKITREEAVRLIRRFDGELPQKNLVRILEYLEISKETFERVIDQSRSAHLWKKEDNVWSLRWPVQ